MKFSYRWLQSYFNKPLPPPAEVARLLTFHLAEVEAVEPVGKDIVLDVKVLPDRAHDCSGHRGLARELGALVNESLLLPEKSHLQTNSDIIPVPLNIVDTKRCLRAISQVITNVRVAPSPGWLVERLAVLGQRSINNIVDATNFLMFDLGQPVHAFDLSKIKGEVKIRRAIPGETLIMLDGREVVLEDSMLVIADDEGPLDLAGIKGGKRAGITEYTQRILLTACNFDGAPIRATAKRVNLATDAAKRFAQGLSPALAETAMDELVLLIFSFGNEDVIGLSSRADQYPEPWRVPVIPLVPRDVNGRLGTNLSAGEIKKIFERLNFKVEGGEGSFLVTPPPERLDLHLKEDLIEEVVRIYGYQRLPSKLLPLGVAKIENKAFATTLAVKSFFAAHGFTENYGYAFASQGDVLLDNPSAADRPYLRTDLSRSLEERLRFNREHTMFETDVVRMFEIGAVFTHAGETTHLALGLAYHKAKQKTKEWEEVLTALWQALGISPQHYDLTEKETSIVVELNWSAIAPLTKESSLTFDESFIKPKVQFKSYSIYPRIVRDVALFVPLDTSAEKVEKKIFDLAQDAAGDLLAAGPILFDTFEKGDKKSLAFRLVFQAFDRTLTDDEVNEIMTKVTTALAKNKDWQLRS